MPHSRAVARVLSSPIDVLSWNAALARVSDWAAKQESRYVCFCNVHSVVTADRNPNFCQIIAAADMTLPDGAPIVWMMRRQGYVDQERINGPDFMWRYFELAAARNEAIYLYGSTSKNLAALQVRVKQSFPKIVIAGTYSPPFRALTSEEDDEVVEAINASGAKTVWVSLGCPKQEAWIAAHRHRIQAVMLGVGAAFDYHSGHTKRAPPWMQNAGLEWLSRLNSDPARLWHRYLVTNTLFVWGAMCQLLTNHSDH